MLLLKHCLHSLMLSLSYQVISFLFLLNLTLLYPITGLLPKTCPGFLIHWKARRVLIEVRKAEDAFSVLLGHQLCVFLKLGIAFQLTVLLPKMRLEFISNWKARIVLSQARKVQDAFSVFLGHQVCASVKLHIAVSAHSGGPGLGVYHQQESPHRSDRGKKI